MTSARAIYSSKRWKRVRSEVLDRDGHACRAVLPTGALCGAVTDLFCRSVTTWLEVHHIVPLAAGGAPFDTRNLVTVCNHCHPSVEAHNRGFRST